MTHEERMSKIASYGKAYDTLVDGIKDFPRCMWRFKESPDHWSIHETIVHIADSEANSYARCRKFIVEPGSEVMAYDESSWASVLRYNDQSTEDALELFKWLRHNTHKLISDLPEEVWANTVYHPENGVMSFDDWLDVYERHIPEHLAQMRETYQAWLRRR